MNRYYSQIQDFIDQHKDEMIEKWRTLVNMEGHFDQREQVTKAQLWLKKEFEAEGFKCRIQELMPQRAGILIGILGEDRPAAPVIFSGHVDTVFHSGAFGKENPFEIRDGKAFGPGVLDMKGGIIIALYVIKALNHIHFTERPIKILFTGEEESDHIGNDADKIFTDESRGAICAFNMETGHIQNCLCVGRKTQYTIFAKVHGLGGHAGNEFFKCKNAVHEAIFKTSHLMKLTNPQEGTTVTVSIITSGNNTNTSSIPDLSEFAVDIRVYSDTIGKKILQEAERILRTNYIEGTSTEYHIDLAKLHPFQPTPSIEKFFNLVNRVAVENGFPEFGQIQLGGASDAGAIAAAGTPVLCSCGPIGEFNHSLKEYAIVDSLFQRTKIYAMAVTELEALIPSP